MSDHDEGRDEAGSRRARVEDWALLGLMPDADERAVRSAYAKKLKSVKPEVDSRGFQALREAYERVRATLAEAQPPPAPREAASEEAAGAEVVDADARDALLHRFEARRRRGDVEGALAIVDEALSGSLRMGWRHAIEDGLFDSVAQDPSTHRRLTQGLAARFDWREATTRQEARDAEGMAALRGRIEAADFVDALREREKAARAGLGPPGDRVLLRVLAPYRVGLFDRGLDPEESAVASEVMSAVFDHLAEVDDVIDTRTIAALRGALGAAPFGKPPPERPSAETAGGEAVSSGSAVNEPRKWRWSAPGGIWLLVVFLAVVSGMRSEWRQSSSPSERRTELPRQRESFDRRAPPIEMSFPIVETDGRLGMDLYPLLDDAVRAKLKGVRFDGPGESPDRLVTMEDLAENSIHYAPAGSHDLSVALVFANGDRTAWYSFDLTKRVAPPASQKPKPEKRAAASESPVAPSSRAPDSDIRFAPSIHDANGRYFLDLSAALTEENLKSLRGVRLQAAPDREAEVIDIAALKAAPLRDIPDGSRRMTIQLLYTNGGMSREFGYDPKAAIDAARTKPGLRKADRDAPEPEAPSPR